MTYKVELFRSDEGYAIRCPDLPGCWSQGASEDEALANIKDAIAIYLESQAELARDKQVRYVEVIAS